jgi:ribosome biogenesis GTPase / thiamine phosphate phosphatase
MARRAPVSFGLAHVSPDDIVAAFPEFVEAVEECPLNCGHRGSPEEPDCMLDVVIADGEASAGRLASLRRLLASRVGIDEPSEG